MTKSLSTFDLRPGLQGFFITCFKNREAVVTKEAYSLLDKSFGVCEDLEEQEGLSVEEALQREVARLKDKKEKVFLSVRMHQVPCMIFIASKHAKKPTQLCEEVQLDGPTRYIQRMIPVDIMCYANIKDIQAALIVLLETAFKEQKSYAVIVEQRMNGSIKKAGLIEMIGEMVGGRGRVDLKQPALVVMVQIVKNVAGLAIIRDYYARNKLNLSVQK